ncbi:unnamed protein product [Owenia fusiformis]|uniref:Uncharacterized protein n=1 Tax=Owenia fusiformis TaxID=6347 RepID=A0A8S4NS26_OWEFU|nr:unnamed protein product [Owenia fusiformis]
MEQDVNIQNWIGQAKFDSVPTEGNDGEHRRKQRQTSAQIRERKKERRKEGIKKEVRIKAWIGIDDGSQQKLKDTLKEVDTTHKQAEAKKKREKEKAARERAEREKTKLEQNANVKEGEGEADANNGTADNDKSAIDDADSAIGDEASSKLGESMEKKLVGKKKHEEDEEEEYKEPEPYVWTDEEIAAVQEELYQAVKLSQKRVIEELLEHPCEPDINWKYYGENLLMLAIREKNEKMALFLIDNGINVNHAADRLMKDLTELESSKRFKVFKYSCRQMAYDRGMTKLVDVIDYQNRELFPFITHPRYREPVLRRSRSLLELIKMAKIAEIQIAKEEELGSDDELCDCEYCEQDRESEVDEKKVVKPAVEDSEEEDEEGEGNDDEGYGTISRTSSPQGTVSWHNRLSNISYSRMINAASMSTLNALNGEQLRLLNASPVGKPIPSVFSLPVAKGHVKCLSSAHDDNKLLTSSPATPVHGSFQAESRLWSPDSTKSHPNEHSVQSTPFKPNRKGKSSEIDPNQKPDQTRFASPWRNDTHATRKPPIPVFTRRNRHNRHQNPIPSPTPPTEDTTFLTTRNIRPPLHQPKFRQSKYSSSGPNNTKTKCTYLSAHFGTKTRVYSAPGIKTETVTHNWPGSLTRSKTTVH